MKRGAYYDRDDRLYSLFLAWADFGHQYVAPFAEQHDANNTFNLEAWRQLGAEGFFDKMGGTKGVSSDYKWWDAVAMLEGLASTALDSGFVVTALSQMAFAFVYDGLTDSAPDFGQLIERLGKGMVTATAIAEPHTGTDIANLQTIATPKGEGWILNGEKTNISHAPTAEWVLVLGRIPELGKKGLTLFLLDAKKHVWECSPPDHKLGNRTLPTASLTFRDIELTRADILGEPGEAMRVLNSMMSFSRALYGMLGPALLRPLMEQAKTFVASRKSGGKSLDDHQHIQRKLAECMMGLEQSRWTAVGAIGQIMDGENMASMASSVAKLTGVRNMERMMRDLLSIFGSQGYQDPLLGRMMRDTMGWMNMGGTEEAQLMSIYNGFSRFPLRFSEPWEPRRLR